MTLDIALAEIPPEFIERIIKEIPGLAASKGSTYTANLGTKIAITEAISSIIVNKLSINPAVLRATKSIVSATLTSFQIYEIVEKASRSSRKLRRECSPSGF